MKLFIRMRHFDRLNIRHCAAVITACLSVTMAAATESRAQRYVPGSGHWETLKVPMKAGRVIAFCADYGYVDWAPSSYDRLYTVKGIVYADHVDLAVERWDHGVSTDGDITLRDKEFRDFSALLRATKISIWVPNIANATHRAPVLIGASQPPKVQLLFRVPPDHPDKRTQDSVVLEGQASNQSAWDAFRKAMAARIKPRPPFSGVDKDGNPVHVQIPPYTWPPPSKTAQAGRPYGANGEVPVCGGVRPRIAV